MSSTPSNAERGEKDSGQSAQLTIEQARTEIIAGIDTLLASPLVPTKNKDELKHLSENSFAHVHSAEPEKVKQMLTSIRNNLKKVEAASAPPSLNIQVAVAPTVRQASQNRTFTLKTLAALIAKAEPVTKEKATALIEKHGQVQGVLEIKKLGGALYFGRYPDNARARTMHNIEACTAIVLDFDGRAGDRVHRDALLAACRKLGIAVLVHDSFSASEDGLTFRAIFPCEELAIDCYQSAAMGLIQKLGMGPKTILPASQGYFFQARPGNKPNVQTFEGKSVDQVLDFDSLEAVADAVAPAGQGQTGKYDLLDAMDHAFDAAGKELYLACLKGIEPWSEDRNHWIGVIGAGLRGFGFTPDLVTKPALQTDEQKALLVTLDTWSKNEHPPAGAAKKYTKNCVVREGENLFGGDKKLGLTGMVRKAYDASPEGIEEFLEGKPELLAMAKRILEGKPANAEQARLEDAAASAAAMFSRINLAPLTLDEIRSAKLTPRVILENLLYADVRVRVAAGGVGKTTLALYEATRLALGLELWGRTPDGPKKTMILTREDQRSVLAARLREIMRAMGLSEEEKHQVMRNIRIIDLSGEPIRLSVIVDDVVMPNHVVLEWIIDISRVWKPDWLIFDPLVSFGVGESRVNDAEQGLVEAFRVLRNELDCCSEGIHHTGKANARDKTSDQYSSRGGTALPDGSRMVAVLNPATPEEWLKETSTPLCEGEDGIVMALPKLSYCPKQDAIFIRRKGYAFSMAKRVSLSPEDVRRADADKVWDFICKEYDKGLRYSNKELENMKEPLGLGSRDAIRMAVTHLKMTGRVKYNEVKGKEGSHYEPVFVNADDFDSGEENRDTPRHPENDDIGIENEG